MSERMYVVLKLKGPEECDQVVDYLQSEEGLSYTREHDGCISCELLVHRDDNTVFIEHEWDTEEGFRAYIQERNERRDVQEILGTLLREKPAVQYVECVDTGGLRKAA